jgi:serine/threonine protein kinase
VVGKSLSHYNIEAELGRGGMGVVYLATDTRLERKVAIKLMTSVSHASTTAREQLYREAKAAAAVSHPNIASVYEVNDTFEEPFIVMEFVPGESLEKRLKQGPLNDGEFHAIVRQLAEGLAEAKSRGVIHRDIKPANIMLSGSGHVKILDFGLAKRTDGTDLTKGESAVGTVCYMSPEQIQGEQVSWCTDAWSLGVVMYEMLTGVKPFDGTYDAAIFYSILNEKHASPRIHDPNIDESTIDLIDKLLSKNPNERCQSFEEVYRLSPTRRTAEIDSPPGSSRHSWKSIFRGPRKLLATSLLLLCALFAFWFFGDGFGERTDTSTLAYAAVAVLPFENISDDTNSSHFGDGLVDDIITSLQGWGAFPVIARSSTRGYTERNIDFPSVAATLGVRYILIGTIRVAADTLRVNAQLIDAETGTQVWADQYDTRKANIFSVQDAITEQIVTALAPEITRNEMRRNTVTRPGDLATWELLIRAQSLIREGTYDSTLEAQALLEQSIERDPGYALSYARLAEVSHSLSVYHSPDVETGSAVQALARSLEYARKSVRMNPSLVDARIWYGHLLLHHRQIPEGVSELRQAVEINNSHAQAHAELGLGLAISGDVEGALSELEIASRLSPNDPRSDRIKTFEALAYLYAEDYPAAVETSRGIINAQPGSDLNIFAYVVWVSALTRQNLLEEARTVRSEYESYYGALDWTALQRSAWSQEQIDQVYQDLLLVGMVQ